MAGYKKTVLGFIGALALAASQYANAAIFQVIDRSALNANVLIDWSAFPPPVVTPETQVVGPLGVTVTSSQGILGRHTQGIDYFGAFAPGDQLLSDAGSQSDTLIVQFATPVASAGTQIQRHSELGFFTAHMDFYNAMDVLLGSAIVNGFGTANGDNSAPFIGAVSTGFDISYVRFWMEGDINLPPQSADLLINRLDVRAQVPAPGMTAVLVPLLGLLWMRRRRSLA